MIKIESRLKYNQLQKRSDIIIFDRSGNPWMIVECKASTKNITQETFEQISIYNKTLKAKFLIVTNGLEHYCWEYENKISKVRFMDKFPKYEQ